MTKPTKKRTLLWAITGVAALAIAGTVTAATVANAEAEETARQCTVATERGSQAAGLFVRSTLDADEVLSAVENTALPGDEGWVSTAFADKPAVEDRSSGADLVERVATAKSAVTSIFIPEDCADREDAATIETAADDIDMAVAELDEQVTALTADFALFQEDERARIAAEVEAARIAAEQEAARIAAEQEAERQRQATQQQQQQSQSNSGSRGSTNGSSGGSKPSGPPPGGQVGGGGPVAPVCDNGMGGTRPC